jgi:hypothetical protein
MPCTLTIKHGWAWIPASFEHVPALWQKSDSKVQSRNCSWFDGATAKKHC